MREKGIEHDEARGRASSRGWSSRTNRRCSPRLSRYPEVIEAAAQQRAPHMLVHYLRELATEFHAYYNAHQFLVRRRRRCATRGSSLIRGVRQVVCNGLGLLGVSAPEAM